MGLRQGATASTAASTCATSRFFSGSRRSRFRPSGGLAEERGGRRRVLPRGRHPRGTACLGDPGQPPWFGPEMVHGREHRIVLGKHSGAGAVQLVMRRLGFTLDDASAATPLLGKVRRSPRPGGCRTTTICWLCTEGAP